MLHSVSPKSMSEDEKNIGKSYSQNQWFVLIGVGVVLLTAHYADLKWTIVAAAVAIVAALISHESRLYDLIIRTQRTNKLLRQMTPADE
jgi:hypothetical protein